MSAKVGILGVAKNVKKIYVGVDGKARRVTKAYTTSDSQSGTRAFTVYEDKSLLQASVTGNFGNLSGYLAAVMSVKGGYNIVGNFVNKYTLSEIFATTSGSQSSVTGRAVSLGSSSAPYTKMTDGAHSLNTTDKVSSLFSGTANGKVCIKKIDIKNMSDGGSFSVNTGISSLSDSSQPSDSVTLASSFPPANYLAVNSNSSSKLVLSHFSNGSLSKTQELPYLSAAGSALATALFVSNETADVNTARTVLCASASANPEIMLIKVASLYYKGSGSFSGISNSNIQTYKINCPASVLYSIGHPIGIRASNSAGTYDNYVYVNTVYSVDISNDKLYLKVIVNFKPADSSKVFEVAEYTETMSGVVNNLRVGYYKWHILGWDRTTEMLYVLQTTNDKLVIKKFNIKDGKITKVSEYDTKKTLSDKVSLNEVIPVTYTSVSYEDTTTSSVTCVPAFMLTVNNQYNEIVIVPRSIM